MSTPQRHTLASIEDDVRDALRVARETLLAGLVERGERLEEVVAASEALFASSERMERAAAALERRRCCVACGVRAALLCAALAATAVIVFAFHPLFALQ